MDNVSIHDNIVDLIEGTGGKLVYAAPYSLNLNPIKLIFESYDSAL